MFDAIVVFGDSLSDTGNAGRFSNGPVWVEHLAERFQLDVRPSSAGGSNFAVGGARLAHVSPNSLPGQAHRYLAEHAVSASTLYVIFGGGNDLLASPVEGIAAVDRAVAALERLAADLLSLGAMHLLVPNLPDVGMTPALRAYGPEIERRAGQLSAQFNAALRQYLAGLRQQYSAARIHELDVWSLAQRARENPQSFGFRDIATPCNHLPSCEGSVFWDSVHPTTAAHRFLGEAAFSAITAQP